MKSLCFKLEFGNQIASKQRSQVVTNVALWLKANCQLLYLALSKNANTTHQRINNQFSQWLKLHDSESESEFGFASIASSEADLDSGLAFFGGLPRFFFSGLAVAMFFVFGLAVGGVAASG